MRARERTYLPVLLTVSFLLRLIPHRTLLLATYDEYLHRAITLRLVREGLGSVSHDILSLLGLRAYSYPPMFHIIGALVYRAFPSNYVFLILPAVYGTIAVFGFYLLFNELIQDRRKAFLATVFLAFAPNFIYRTSLFIPENLGLVLFSFSMLFLVRFLRHRRVFDLIILAAVFTVYTFTHRGWVFFAIASVIIIASVLWPVLRKNLQYVIAAVILVYMIYVKVDFVHSLVSDFFLRMQKSEVSFLGYFKWVGVIQLVFGVLATRMYFERDSIRRGFALWAWAFLLWGGISFRFRDPYAAIPLSAMAAEFVVEKVVPNMGHAARLVVEGIRGFGASAIKRIVMSRYVQTALIIALLLIPVAQGAYGAAKYITPPSVTDREAYEWIKENTPQNAVFLVWWDMGYLLIGNTHRKDIVIWKKVYQGFFEKAPTPKEAIKAYGDHVVMFSSNQRERAYYLMKLYNVSYVFVDKKRRSYGLIKYGLMEYAPYDTHFKLEFCNGNAEIYRFIPNPQLQPWDLNPLNYTGKYAPLVGYLEKFWTGYNYADFDDRYKAYFDLNAWIVRIYLQLYRKTGDERFRERAEWLLRWLSYKQMNDGAFPAGVPPNDFTLYTAYTLEPLGNMSFAGRGKALNLLKRRERSDFIMTTPKDKRGGLVTDALMLPIYRELGVLNKTTGRNILKKILDEQKGDGSWNENLGTTTAIASSLARYYQLTGNETVLEAVKKAAEWLKGQENEDGKFKGEKVEYGYSRSTYAKALMIYHIAGMSGMEDKVFRLITGTFNPSKEQHPLQAVIDIYRILTYIYGEDRAVQVLNSMLEQHPLPDFS
ncbi:glycosyltransferase family 39 protein [Thermococcus atlanticus]